ncbi:MAG: Sua5/YciO/YrdC/YwlC family protein [Candidatus Cloacimonetes bacterium]|nr:Sua5/YciO/YrdC/YwlC family protein [Candidatus Cloacimonadota bacterium]
MQICKDPSVNKLEKTLSKNPLEDSTILHWTGSMWGIGCRLSSVEAIQRINQLKQRPDKHGYIALIPDMSVLDISKVPSALKPLLEQYWPGNLTVVFDYDDPQYKEIAVNGKVAFRVPSDPLLRAFIAMLKEPLISTSINVSGLLPEEDYNRIERNYAAWFDFALLPPAKEIRSGTEYSTIVEYVRTKEAKSTSTTDEMKCLREGSVPFYEIKQSFKLPLVTFVCTANICRSPIAEKLFRVMISNGNLSLASDSCGLIEGGHNISLSSMQLLLERGITEAQEHVSKQITPQMVTSSWLVLTMEERQRNWLREQNPNSERKILTLNEIVGESGDIVDPYGSDLESYRKTFALIEDRLIRLMDMIKSNSITEKESGI